jgi:hypothetical protein
MNWQDILAKALAAVEAIVQILEGGGQPNPAQVQQARQHLEEAKQHMAAAGNQPAQQQPAQPQAAQPQQPAPEQQAPQQPQS